METCRNERKRPSLLGVLDKTLINALITIIQTVLESYGMSMTSREKSRHTLEGVDRRGYLVIEYYFTKLAASTAHTFRKS